MEYQQRLWVTALTFYVFAAYFCKLLHVGKQDMTALQNSGNASPTLITLSSRVRDFFHA